MSRRKRENQLLLAAQAYIRQNLPALQGQPLRLRLLDGPPGAPRYAAMTEICRVPICPRGFSAQAGPNGPCEVPDCPLRQSVRLLLDRQGNVVGSTLSGVHWN